MMDVFHGVHGRLEELLRRVDDSNRALWLAVLFPLLGLYLITLRIDPSSMSPDTISVTGSAWQLAHHGTPRLPADTGALPDWLVPSGADHLISNRAPGLVYLAAPFYFLMPWAGITDVTPASIAAALITASAMATLALVFRRLVSARTALAGALVAGTATTTWAVSGTSLWPHGPDQLFFVAAVLALAAGASGRAGLAFGATAFLRPPLAVVAAISGVWEAWERRSVRPLATIGVPTAVGLVGYLAYSQRYWEGGLDGGYQAVGPDYAFTPLFTDTSLDAWQRFATGILGTLISPGRGIFVGSPFLVVLVCGLPAAWRVAPPWARSAAVGGVVYMLIVLKANLFGGGASFWSYRYPLETLTLAAPLLMLAWREWVSTTRRRRSWFWTLAIVAVTLQALGAACFRHKGTVWWAPSDLHNAVADCPYVAIPIAVTGYVGAAVVYRLLSTKGESAADNEPVAQDSASVSTAGG